MNFEDTFIGRDSTKRSQLSLWRTNIQPHTNVPDYQLGEMFIRSMMNKWSHHSPGTQKLLISLCKRYVLFKTGKDVDCKSLVRIAGRSKPDVDKVILTKEETKKLLDAARQLNKSLYNTILFALHTGCRISEILSLTTADFDFQNKEIKVVWSKNGKARKVPMTSTIEQLLKGGPVFRGSGENKSLTELCRLAGVRRVTWHSFRHAFITRALEAGLSPKKVAKIVGHSNVSTTLNCYWGLTDKPSSDDLNFMEEQ